MAERRLHRHPLAGREHARSANLTSPGGPLANRPSASPRNQQALAELGNSPPRCQAIGQEEESAALLRQWEQQGLVERYGVDAEPRGRRQVRPHPALDRRRASRRPHRRCCPGTGANPIVTAPAGKTSACKKCIGARHCFSDFPHGKPCRLDGLVGLVLRERGACELPPCGFGRPLTSHKPTYMRLSGHSILAVPGSGCTFNCGPIATRLKAVE
jgi:hypothetical protein